MDFNLKTYKRLKIKHYFKTVNFFFFFHGVALNNENWTKTEQFFFRQKLQYFRIYNTLLTNILKNSIFKNLNVLVHGLLVLIKNQERKLTLKELKDNNPLTNILCLKLNNKIYSSKQIEKIREFSYPANVFLLYKSMNFFIKKPYYKLKNTKVALTSK